jgi:predicted lipid-binding transport protein (Tim44 family)
MRHGGSSAFAGRVVIVFQFGVAFQLGVVHALLTRAGGGQGFSGGGGGGGGGGISGGGGGVFVGGGGGGGGSGGGGGIIGAIVLTLIVVGIFFTVRRGRRRMGGGWLPGARRGAGAATIPPASTPTPIPWTGSQEPAINSVRGDLFPGSHAEAHEPVNSVADGLAAIKAHDPAFNEERFLQQVQKSFFVVEEAWSDRKPGVSRQVMAEGLWQQHRVQIEQYVEGHKRNVLEDLAVGDMAIVGAHSDQTFDTITVRIFAACADYDVDDNSGKVVRGNKHVDQWQEDWSFQRSSTATTKDGGGTLSSKCPNCGAPLDVDLQGVCKYCHAPVMSGDYDWVLARIGQVNL